MHCKIMSSWEKKGALMGKLLITTIVPILGGVPLHSHDPIKPISAWRWLGVFPTGRHEKDFTKQKK